MGSTVLIVDDDAAQLAITETMLAQKCHYRTLSALGGRAALERFMLRQSPKPDIMLLDLIMPDMNGVEVVRAVRRCDAHIPIVMLAPPDQEALVMQALQAGASDCLRKPANLGYMKMVLDKQLQREAMREELCRLSRYGRADFRYEDAVGESTAIRQLLRQIRDVASQSIPVCLEGETGSGKELLARIMHSASGFSEGLFVSVNCRSAQPFFEVLAVGHYESALETLAVSFKAGQGRSLFFRHIEALPMPQQEALADFLIWVRKFGGKAFAQLRFIASCLEPLSELYRLGRLHEKLYLYFSGCVLRVPALRDRPEDIPLLCRYYLKRFTATQPVMMSDLSVEAIRILEKQFWSGNVSELIALMQRASFRTHGAQLEAGEVRLLLDPTYVAPPRRSSENTQARAEQLCLLASNGDVRPMEELEAEMIRFAIRHYNGRMTEVAKKLGIGRSTLYRKMQDYKLRVA